MLLGMADSRDRRGTVTDENRQESARLLKIWLSEKGVAARRASGCYSQGAFGDAYGIGNQAAVGFFLNGKTAISLKAALAFARGLDCQVSDFSERLAELAKTNAPNPSAWPFRMVKRARWDACDQGERGYIEAAINRAMDECEAARGEHSSGGAITEPAQRDYMPKLSA